MGLKRVQIQGLNLEDDNESQTEQEYLLDEQGNIYDLNGNFVATMGNEESD